MNILILGASGMVGHMLALRLSESGHSILTLARKHPYDSNTKLLDASNFNELGHYLNNLHIQPDVIINCIAVLPKNTEQNKFKAILLNSALPQFLERTYFDTQTKVITISTDAVYSGNKKSYVESDSTDGTSVYAKTKMLGEIQNSKDVTLRLSVIGPCLDISHGGMFDWALRETGEVSGYTDSLWNGVTSLHLASVIDYVVNTNIHGTFHVASSEQTSKHNLLSMIREVFDLDLQVKPITNPNQSLNTRLTPTDKSGFPAAPGYVEMLEDLKLWMHSHQEIYRHYER